MQPIPCLICAGAAWRRLYDPLIQRRACDLVATDCQALSKMRRCILSAHSPTGPSATVACWLSLSKHEQLRKWSLS